MAAPSKLNQRAERDLEALQSFIADLPALAEVWATLEDGPKATLSLDWDHLMDSYLTELHDYACRGRLTPDQVARYHDLLGKLKGALPTIALLNLSCPPVPLEV